MFKELSDNAEGSDNGFLAAISDIAGGFAKIWHKGGEPHAMVSMLAEGIKALEPYQPRYLNIELDEFVRDLALCMSEAKRWRRGETEIFNRDMIPRLQFSKDS